MAGTQETLGPVDPTWLAKLSAHLGVNPVKTLSTFLSQVWEGHGVAAVCCREVCATLMQADSGSVPLSLVDTHVQQVLRKKALALSIGTTLQTILDDDPHFGLESGANGDVLVCLLMDAMPAPAVAKLYLSAGVPPEEMLSPEKALLHACLHLTWPRALSDDDEYLAAQIGALLLDEAEAFPGANRGLPRYSMHLTEVGGCLRSNSNHDPRLSQIFPKGQYMKSKRPRLSEFLIKEQLQTVFRVQESLLRSSEKVVTLRTEVLLRSLGPLAGLLQSALSRPSLDSRSLRLGYTPDAGSLAMAASVSTCGSGFVQSSPPPGVSAAAWIASQGQRSPGSAACGHIGEEHESAELRREDSMPLNDLLEQGAAEAQRAPSPAPPHATPVSARASAFPPPNSGALFLRGLDTTLPPQEVPQEIRSVWSDAPSPAPPPSQPISVYHKTPEKVSPGLVAHLGAIGATPVRSPHANGSAHPHNSELSCHTSHLWDGAAGSAPDRARDSSYGSCGLWGPNPPFGGHHGSLDTHVGLHGGGLHAANVTPGVGARSPGGAHNLWAPPELSRMSSESDISSSTLLATHSGHNGARSTRQQQQQQQRTGSVSRPSPHLAVPFELPRSAHAPSPGAPRPCPSSSWGQTSLHAAAAGGGAPWGSTAQGPAPGSWTRPGGFPHCDADTGTYSNAMPLTAPREVGGGGARISGGGGLTANGHNSGVNEPRGAMTPSVNGDRIVAAPSSGPASWASTPWLNSSPRILHGDLLPAPCADAVTNARAALASTSLRPMNYATALRAPPERSMPVQQPPPPRDDHAMHGAPPGHQVSLQPQQPPPPPLSQQQQPQQHYVRHEGGRMSQHDLVSRLDARNLGLLDILGSVQGAAVLAELSGVHLAHGDAAALSLDDLNHTFLAIAKRHLVPEPPQNAPSHVASRPVMNGGAAPQPQRPPVQGPPPTASLLQLLRPQVRTQVQDLITQHHRVLRAEHFDNGVIHQLKTIQSRSDAAAVAALKEIVRRADFHTANNMPAYLTHWLMKIGAEADASHGQNGVRGALGAGMGGRPAGKPDLKKLPRQTVSLVDTLVNGSPWLDWRHFDAGVMKVLQQLACANENEALLELKQVEDSDLASVKNMPAYLNKCFNNRLWKVRQ